MVTGTAQTAQDVYRELLDLDRPCYIVRTPSGVGATSDPRGQQVLAAVGPLPPERLGDPDFRAAHGVTHAYHAGAMANGIASARMVAALANKGFLGSFGAAGVLPERVDEALTAIRRDAPGRPFAVNLIHAPSEAALERAVVDLCLKHEVRCVEASAFLDLTPQVVRYRAAGLTPDGPRNRLIAKVSRAEVAEKFLRPAPDALLRPLVEAGAITAGQAELARRFPMADDITAEADSGGHTDRRPLVVLLPEIIAVRDRIRRELPGTTTRIGAAGGIGTPAAAAAAFGLGAAYVVTGSINQSCVEADQSEHAKRLLAAAGVADCGMAPSSDMFELGVDVQVLKRGTMFAGRAKKLYELYRAHDGLADIPPVERADLEAKVFQRPLDDVWRDCVTYFTERDPEQIHRARDNPKRRMALVFRWYLGLSSGWSIRGVPERAADYQIWCGPAMGAFNQWVAGTHLAAHREVADVATHLMRGAAFASRVGQLRLAGVRLPAECATYVPSPTWEER